MRVVDLPDPLGFLLRVLTPSNGEDGIPTHTCTLTARPPVRRLCLKCLIQIISSLVEHSTTELSVSDKEDAQKV